MWRQDDQKFKAILSYVASLKLAWATGGCLKTTSQVKPDRVLNQRSERPGRENLKDSFPETLLSTRWLCPPSQSWRPALCILGISSPDSPVPRGMTAKFRHCMCVPIPGGWGWSGTLGLNHPTPTQSTLVSFQ